MNIGEASAVSGVSAKMIRYYERIGLIAKAGRTQSGYRAYAQTDVETLRFLARARSLGFVVGQMRDLLALWRDEKRASADVKRLALAHVAVLDTKAREIAEMSQALRDLAERCDGDHRPGCPIIDDLARIALAVGEPDLLAAPEPAVPRDLNDARFAARPLRRHV